MNTQKIKRQKRVRSKVQGSTMRPRLSVHKSIRYIYVQVIDDEKRKALFGVSEKHLPKADAKATKTDRAKQLGLLIAKMAQDKKIKTVVFDRGSFPYHGRIKALADGAREGGLTF